jgi:hypothetical protein
MAQELDAEARELSDIMATFSVGGREEAQIEVSD